MIITIPTKANGTVASVLRSIFFSIFCLRKSKIFYHLSIDGRTFLTTTIKFYGSYFFLSFFQRIFCKKNDFCLRIGKRHNQLFAFDTHTIHVISFFSIFSSEEKLMSLVHGSYFTCKYRTVYSPSNNFNH